VVIFLKLLDYSQLTAITSEPWFQKNRYLRFLLVLLARAVLVPVSSSQSWAIGCYYEPSATSLDGKYITVLVSIANSFANVAFTFT
jgi:hypothetical protein